MSPRLSPESGVYPFLVSTEDTVEVTADGGGATSSEDGDSEDGGSTDGGSEDGGGAESGGGGAVDGVDADVANDSAPDGVAVGCGGAVDHIAC